MTAKSSDIYHFGEYRLDLSRRMLSHGDSPVALNAKSFDLLSYLVENHGRVVSKEEILNEVWKDQFVEEGNLSVQISHLRKALGDNASEPLFIATIPGKGYQFLGNVEAVKIGDPKPKADRTQNATPLKWVIAALAAIVTISAVAAWFFVSSGRNDVRPVKSVAVLPFVDETGSGDLSYLGDGIAESVIFDLSRIAQLRVMSRDSSFRFRNDTPVPVKVGVGLDVDAILTGRILRLGDSIAVRTELVSASDGSVIWGEQFIRKPEDIEKIHRDISASIARFLQLPSETGSETAVIRDGTDSHEAYQSYLLGRFHLNRLTDDGFEKARESFQASIDNDPRYASAYVGLADSYNYLAGWGSMPPNDSFPFAKAAAVKAIELEPQNAEAYTSLGVVRLFYDLDFAGAESAFAESIRMNPSNAEAHHMLAYAFLTRGRFEEARASVLRSRELDPLSLLRLITLGNTYAYERNHEAALSEYGKALEMDRNSGLARWSIGNVLIQQGKYPEAIAELEHAVRLSGDSADEPASLAIAYARSGKSEEARRILRQLKEDPTIHAPTSIFAIIHAALGEKDEAFTLLDRAVRERDPLVPFLKVDPLFDPLRDEARFAQMLSRAGFQ